MHELEAAAIQCPYCWERIELLIDTSVERQAYVEDCPVCCRPIAVSVDCSDEAGVQVEARGEDE